MMVDISAEDWSERARTDRARVLRTRMLDRAAVSELSQRSGLRLFTSLALDYLLILAAAMLCELYWHPLGYVVTVMWVGARQVGIGSVALHDGAHFMLLRDRRSNDLLARVLLWSILAPAVTLTLDSYRSVHFPHHREVNSDADPDWPMTQYNCGSRLRALLLLATGLCGVLALYLFFTYLRSGGWLRRVVALSCVTALALGATFSVRPVELFLLYYLVPLATWGMFVNQVRLMAEHYPHGMFGRDPDVPEVFLTRDVKLSPFDALFVTTRSVNYHLTHHLFPSVPFYNLARLQRLLAKSAAYREAAHVTRGYHRFLIELLLKRSSAFAR